MRISNEDNTLLASLAVSRELYNAEKDVYGVISIFLKELIKTQRLYSFNLNEITSKLNTIYEFDIPQAVVRTSLARLKFIEKEKTNYIISDINQIKDQSISQKQKAILDNNENIVQRLYDFIEKR